MSIIEYTRQNNLNGIIKLVENGCCINIKDEYGRTPLRVASQYGHFEIVKFLIQHNALLDEKDKYAEETALINACTNNRFEIIKYLVQHNASVNQKNAYGGTALMEATYYGHFKIVKFLVQHGALVNEIDNYCWTAVASASRKNHFKIIKYLIRHGAKIKHRFCIIKKVILKRIHL